MSDSAPDYTKFDTAIITVHLSPETVEKAKKTFKTVHYYPDEVVPKNVLADADIWLASWAAFPKAVERLEEIPKLKVLQVTSGAWGVAHLCPVPPY